MKKESNWIECIKSNSSLKVSQDKEKAKSLIDTAKGRVDFLKKIRLDKDNASYVFESYYSSVLEMLHALVLLSGYKVNNHICLGYYIRDVLKKENLFRKFDDCRYKKNSLVYYGKKMDFGTARDTIDNCLLLIKEIKLLLKNKLSK